MSIDVKMFNGCNHVIDGKRYKLEDCPLCNGFGLYYDICFDREGQVITCSKSTKLQQEVLKIINDKKFANKFHKEWGNMLINIVDNGIIGKKNLPNTKEKIKMIIYKTLEYLKSLQVNNQIVFKNMNDEEILKNILDIQVTPINNIGYEISISFDDLAGNIYTQKISI